MEASVAQLPTGINVKAVAKQVRKGEVVCVDIATGDQLLEPADLIVGLLKTVESQGKTIGALSRQLEELDGNLTNHPQGSELMAELEWWRTGTGKVKAKRGATRIKRAKARLKDGYPVSTEETEPSIAYAIDGLVAFPYRNYNRRYAVGKKAHLDNDLSAALKDEKHIEGLSRLGLKARSLGWTRDNRWPGEPPAEGQEL